MNCADAPALYRYNLMFILINIYVTVNIIDIYINVKRAEIEILTILEHSAKENAA